MATTSGSGDSNSNVAPPSRKHMGIPQSIFVCLLYEEVWTVLAIELLDHRKVITIDQTLSSPAFPEDVVAFMKKPGNETADLVLRRLDEQYQKYKFMELNLSQKKRRLRSQIPEIKQTLEILKHMQKKKDSTDPMETMFLLADNLYAKASVPPTDKVCLWLGANVMLEYDIDEARALLEKNLTTATRNLEGLEDDLDFLRDQFTTTEVNMARVYNWDVKRRSSEAASKSTA